MIDSNTTLLDVPVSADSPPDREHQPQPDQSGAMLPRQTPPSCSTSDDEPDYYEYVIVLLETLSCPPLPEHVMSELMKRSQDMRD